MSPVTSSAAMVVQSVSSASDGPPRSPGPTSSPLVLRADIVARCGPKDVFVDVETGVNTAVRKLRQALNDSVRWSSPAAGALFADAGTAESKPRRSVGRTVRHDVERQGRAPETHRCRSGSSGARVPMAKRCIAAADCTIFIGSKDRTGVTLDWMPAATSTPGHPHRRRRGRDRAELRQLRRHLADAKLALPHFAERAQSLDHDRVGQRGGSPTSPAVVGGDIEYKKAPSQGS